MGVINNFMQRGVLLMVDGDAEQRCAALQVLDVVSISTPESSI